MDRVSASEGSRNMEKCLTLMQYKSIITALTEAGWLNGVQPEMNIVDSTPDYTGKLSSPGRRRQRSPGFFRYPSLPGSV